MNIKNLEFLKEGLKYLGFGDKLNENLENKIKEQPPEFKLGYAGEFKKNTGDPDTVYYTLDFKKSEQSDMYFLNRYQATLKAPHPDLERSQTFYITKNAGITAREAYNLLSGRSVNKDLTNKEGQPYNAWLQLDFQEQKDKNENFKVKQYHSGYGYDLEMVIAKYPIKEQLDQDQKTKLMKSLEKGNITQVTFAREGGEEKMFVTANPQFKTLDLYNAKMEKQFQGVEKKVAPEENRSNDQSQKQEKKKDGKQEAEEESESKKEARTRRRGMRV